MLNVHYCVMFSSRPLRFVFELGLELDLVSGWY